MAKSADTVDCPIFDTFMSEGECDLRYQSAVELTRQDKARGKYRFYPCVVCKQDPSNPDMSRYVAKLKGLQQKKEDTLREQVQEQEQRRQIMERNGIPEPGSAIKKGGNMSNQQPEQKAGPRPKWVEGVCNECNQPSKFVYRKMGTCVKCVNARTWEKRQQKKKARSKPVARPKPAPHSYDEPEHDVSKPGSATATIQIHLILVDGLAPALLKEAAKELRSLEDQALYILREKLIPDWRKRGE